MLYLTTIHAFGKQLPGYGPGNDLSSSMFPMCFLKISVFVVQDDVHYVLIKIIYLQSTHA